MKQVLTFSVATVLALHGLTGCSQLAESYRTIALGKPLDRSALPPDALIVEYPTLRTTKVIEYRQSLFPIGIQRRTLTVDLDVEEKVRRLDLEEYSGSYWVLFVTGDNRRQLRYLDEQNPPKEQRNDTISGLSVMSFLNPFFSDAVARCFGDEMKTDSRHLPRVKDTFKPAPASQSATAAPPGR